MEDECLLRALPNHSRTTGCSEETSIPLSGTLGPLGIGVDQKHGELFYVDPEEEDPQRSNDSAGSASEKAASESPKVVPKWRRHVLPPPMVRLKHLKEPLAAEGLHESLNSTLNVLASVEGSSGAEDDGTPIGEGASQSAVASEEPQQGASSSSVMATDIHDFQVKLLDCEEPAQAGLAAKVSSLSALRCLLESDTHLPAEISPAPVSRETAFESPSLYDQPLSSTTENIPRNSSPSLELEGNLRKPDEILAVNMSTLSSSASGHEDNQNMLQSNGSSERTCAGEGSGDQGLNAVPCRTSRGEEEATGKKSDRRRSSQIKKLAGKIKQKWREGRHSSKEKETKGGQMVRRGTNGESELAAQTLEQEVSHTDLADTKTLQHPNKQRNDYDKDVANANQLGTADCRCPIRDLDQITPIQSGDAGDSERASHKKLECKPDDIYDTFELYMVQDEAVQEQEEMNLDPSGIKSEQSRSPPRREQSLRAPEEHMRDQGQAGAQDEGFRMLRDSTGLQTAPDPFAEGLKGPDSSQVYRFPRFGIFKSPPSYH